MPVSGDHLVVNEIFYSVQGESTHAGRPCAFVRLTACNLRCNYCDTEYAFYEGRRMTVAEVVEQVEGYHCPLVEITGGEPLLQEGVYQLCAALLEADLQVMIETSGAADVSRLDPRVIKIMDLKCPGSGEAGRNLWSNLRHLTARDEVKFVISDRADYEWTSAVIAEHALEQRQPGGLDAGGSAAGAPSTSDAQVHLAAQRPRRLNPHTRVPKRGRRLENLSHAAS
jgi:7-carboxy-7-deazaguanine synthase